MNPEAEKKAASLGITYWELLALLSIEDFGKMWAKSGSSALFDAAWALERRGLLKVSYELGTWLLLTDEGAMVLQAYHALPPSPEIDLR